MPYLLQEKCLKKNSKERILLFYRNAAAPPAAAFLFLPVLSVEINLEAKQHIEEINKQLVIRGTSPNTQLIRLAGDVFFIGPVLMYAGIRKSDMPIVLRVIITGIGAATIYYNLKNFIQVEKIIHELKKLEETKNESPRK